MGATVVEEIAERLQFMNKWNWIKMTFIIGIVVVQYGVTLSFAYEANPEDVAAETQLYVEGGVKTLGQHRGIRIATEGGTQCNRLKKLESSYTAPLHVESGQALSAK